VTGPPLGLLSQSAGQGEGQVAKMLAKSLAVLAEELLFSGVCECGFDIFCGQ